MRKTNVELADRYVVYNFRGEAMMKFDFDYNHFKITRHAAMCNFIDEDYDLMIEFIKQCKDYKAGKLNKTEMVDIEVN